MPYIQRVSRIQQLSGELWTMIDDREDLRRAAERVLEETQALVEDLMADKRNRSRGSVVRAEIFWRRRTTSTKR
jgi:hypothetical protein